MTRFTSHISTLLYAILLAVLAFVTIIILASMAVLTADVLSPGALGTVHLNRGAIDITAPGAIPMFLGIMSLVLALSWTALWPLIQMLRSTAAGQPFTWANVKRLNLIAATIAVAYVLQFVLPPLLPFDAQDIVKPMGADGVFAILLTLVLAQVFREGVRLREDAEGTI